MAENKTTQNASPVENFIIAVEEMRERYECN